MLDPIVCYSGGQLDAECMMAQEGGMQVNGSHAFCLNNVCNPLSSCWCAYVVVEDTSTCGGEQAMVAKVRVVISQNLNASYTIHSNVARSTSMFLSWDQPKVKVSFTSEQDRQVMLQKDGRQYLRTCSSVSCEYVMEPEFYSQSGYCYGTAQVEGTLVASTNIWIEAATWCKQYMSIWKIYPEWDCLSSAQQAFAVFVLMLLAMLVIIALPPVLAAVVALAKMFWAVTNCCYRSVRSSPASVTVQNVFRGAYRSVLPTIMLIVAVSACQQSSSIGFTNEVCSISSGVQTCSSSFSGVFQVTSAGQSMCWFEKDGSTSFEIKYLYTVKLPVLSFMYHSSDWTMKEFSRYRCNSQSCSSSVCEQADKSKSNNPNGQFSETDAVSYDGPSGCFSVSDSIQASILNGCSGLNPNCLYWKASIIPTGKAFSAHRVNSVRNVVAYNITVVTGEGSTTETVYADGPTVYRGVTISPDVPTFDNQISTDGACVLSTSDRNYYSKCSRVGFPTAGMIGDIQSNFDLGLEPTAKILYDPRIVTAVEPHSKSVTVSYIQSAVKSQLNSTFMLPTTKNGVMWGMVNGSLVGVDPRQTSFSTFVSSDSFNYTKRVELPCPVMESPECTGCFNCQAGAKIRVQARSSCIEGSATLTVAGERKDRKSIFLRQTNEYFEIGTYINEQVSSVDVCIDGVCEETKCNLSEVRELDDGKEILVTDSTEKDDTASPTRWFEDIFNGIGSWWQWLLAVGLVILVIIIAVMLAPLAFSMIKGLRMPSWRKSSKVETPIKDVEVATVVKQTKMPESRPFLRPRVPNFDLRPRA
jgi:hypothetical protein